LIRNRRAVLAEGSMRFHPPYSTAALGAASAALCFAVALAVPAAFVAQGPDSRLAPGLSDPGISDTVNRDSKGDRLRVIVRPPDEAPFEVQVPPGSSPKSVDGCESAFGPMDLSSAARLAQSCVT
jgi:hypothetical protein